MEQVDAQILIKFLFFIFVISLVLIEVIRRFKRNQQQRYL